MEREGESEPEPELLTPEAFAKQMFGEADTPQSGMPSLSWLKSQFKTKSARIRYLINEGFQTKDIAKHLGVRYQHVRNVAIQKLKRGPNESYVPKNLCDAQQLKPQPEVEDLEEVVEDDGQEQEREYINDYYANRKSKIGARLNVHDQDC